jgi:hypothetical protein
MINLYGLKNLAHLNLHLICKHWCIANKLDHFFFFLFSPLFLLFSFFPFCKAFMIIHHSSSHGFNQLMTYNERKLQPIQHIHGIRS